MANHCSNKLEIAGPVPLVDAFFRRSADEALDGPERDFESLFYLSRCDPTPAYAQGDWRRYRWSVSGLGPDHAPLERDEDGQRAILYLDAPWHPPTGLVERAAQHFPGLAFRLRFQEPGNAFYGTYTWAGGTSVALEDYEPDDDAKGSLWEETESDLYAILDDLAALPDAPATAFADKLTAITQVEESGAARSHLNEILEEGHDREIALTSAAFVMPEVDVETARELLYLGHLAPLRYAQKLSGEARSLVRQAAMDILLEPPPVEAASVPRSSLPALSLDPMDYSEWVRAEEMAPAQPSKDELQLVESWVEHLLGGSRILDEIIEGEAPPPLTREEVDRLWAHVLAARSLANVSEHELDLEGEFRPFDTNRPVRLASNGHPLWAVNGQRRLVGHALAQASELSSNQLSFLLEDAPTGSAYWREVLSHEDLDRDEVLRTLDELEERTVVVRPPYTRLARRSRKEEDKELAERMLAGTRPSDELWSALLEGGSSDWLDVILDKMISRDPARTVRILRDMAEQDDVSVAEHHLVSLLSHGDSAVREEAIYLSGYLDQ